jgi:DNA-binding GntR family transcriptional regulator
LSVLPIQPTSLASTVAELLREDLLSGALPPGTVLDGAALVERTGVPPTTVRAALTELARDGLVVHSLHRGPEVVRIGRDEVRDIFAARRVYETAGLAALMRGGAADVTWLRAAAERMGEAAVAGDGRAAVEADIAFHLGLVAAAGSSHLTRAAQAALMELRLVLSVADRQAGDLPALVADHEHLIAIVEAGDALSATDALEDHLGRGEAAVLAAACDDLPRWPVAVPDGG